MAGGGPAVPQLFLSPGLLCVRSDGPQVSALASRCAGPSCPHWGRLLTWPWPWGEDPASRFKGPGLGSADTCQCDLNAEALSWTLSRRLEATRPGPLLQRPAALWPEGRWLPPMDLGVHRAGMLPRVSSLLHLGYFCTCARICSAMSLCLWVPGRTEQADECGRFWHTWPNVHTSLVQRVGARPNAKP